MPRRNLRAHAIRPKIYFSMPCLRTCTKEYTLDMAQPVPFSVDCLLDATASVLCHQCSARKSLCSPASAGMLGNAKELSVAIETCRTVFFVRVQGTLDENKENDVDMDPAVLEPVSAAILGLVKAFDNAEMAHRKEHRLTDSKKTKAAALREYHDHLNVRRGLPNSTPLLRLLPGDEGYVAWLAAKMNFEQRIAAVLRDYFEGADATTLSYDFDNGLDLSLGWDFLDEL
ncbi:hypothetical protein FE257_004641 [Aspergillus nanangensis]|uniref:Uncharacterized protein n=1 Tax=Aspergillus nanangensis TaxID=2582783 RepID=A0AAD4GZF5_ASPNN|nr:hypothetical protein FE257_004641 [Aspergillus nanangensis]